jgi:hypothetical protein
MDHNRSFHSKLSQQELQREQKMEKSLPPLNHLRAQSSRRTDQLQQLQSNAENLPHVFDRARP